MNIGATHSTPKQLLAAYSAAAGYPVIPNRQIEDWLKSLCRAGFHADDVRAVVEGIKWHQKNGTRGYTEASIFVKNALDPINFVPRAMKAREKKAAREKREAAKVATPAVPAPKPLPLDPKVSAGFVELKKMLRGGNGV